MKISLFWRAYGRIQQGKGIFNFKTEIKLMITLQHLNYIVNKVMKINAVLNCFFVIKNTDAVKFAGTLHLMGAGWWDLA